MLRIQNVKAIVLLTVFIFGVNISFAKKKKDDKEEKTKVEASLFSGLKWRSIGPSFTSGRIADFAVDPNNINIYYVAVASGHIWKTVNNGTTFSPIFDNKGTYSIGCLTMDPSNSNVVWAGTGENNHQRALGYGNGVYKTTDGGKSWKNMGLKDSRQIGEILVDPVNSNIVYVAAEGSAWGPGEERGVFKTIDGGENWEKVLFVSENTGIANLSFEPGNPNVIYAGAEQRRRHQYAKIGGGPESAFYKTTDAGANWSKLENGIPGVDKGGMEIVVSPANPDYVYVMFEASNKKGGVFRSTNKGASFKKMDSYSSSGQYYSELICDPHNKDKVYSMDTWSKYTTDGGKTWKNVGNNSRHVDDHAIWLDPVNEGHFIIGGDGGVYESWDAGKTYIFKANLPVTQFYRVNVDNTEPFYWVYGGTQDNNSLGGPSQNTKRSGVGSDEWVVTLGGDGFWQATESSNPDIVYSAYQYGNISRYDRKSGEKLGIKPTPRKGELTYRWNWDAPFILSTFKETRLYMAANKVFKSDDRGNSWQVISEDLTRDEDRNQFKVMGKYWPSSAVAKNVSTSQWGTIVSLAESTIKEGLIYVGTDDGLIQVTEDGGENWTKISSFPGIPEYTYVSDVYPSTHDENIVFATFNNTKSDDFKPYVLKSNDKGKTWSSITSNLPENGSVHSVLQDVVNANLLFVGTEFSFYFSFDGGNEWTKFANGLPDIAVRDIVIQEREKDLVIATFGRGFYIIDDYSPLRELSAEKLESEKAIIFPVKDALMYVQEGGRYGQGSGVYMAKNPQFGANFTYYLNEVPKSLKSKRLKREKELFKEGEQIPQPTKEILDEEKAERGPYLKFAIKDMNGEVVKVFYKSASKGINRANWDLRYQSPGSINLKKDKFDPTNNSGSSFRALPGNYTVEFSMVHNGEETPMAGPVEFKANVLNNSTLPAKDKVALDNFNRKVMDLWRVTSGANDYFELLKEKTAYVQQALQQSPKASLESINAANDIKIELEELDFLFEGTPAKASSEEVPPEQVSLSDRFNSIAWVAWQSTSAPTATQMKNYEILMEEFPPALEKLKSIEGSITEMESLLDELNAPYTPGRVPKF